MTESEHRALSDKFMLRMPDGMRDRIKRAAEASGRSMNSEILAVLHEKYPEPLPGTDLEDRLKTLAQRIAEETDPDERQAKLVQFRKELDETLGLKVGAVLDMHEAKLRR
ncbi:Arc family DNA-binding protein [Salibaculum sp.]|uniref:Arc family DNA-binding protein n=1 Tax=Salibaculum sp. TaxID=2855480 RepID=UPI002B45E58C|nr:Arc family DNA-binding protein [Salibaculum sp.]HKL70858.1 Arc family DNA-binding protein [Salibaculum sp.]